MRATSLVVVVTLAALLAGCGGGEGDDGGGGSATKIPRLVIGHVNHDHQIALGVAALQPERMREACGLHLEELKPREVYRFMEGDTPLAEFHIKKVGGGSRMPAAMAEGAIDIGLGGIPAVVFFIDKGSDITMLCPLNVDGDMLVMRPDFPAATWPEFVEAVKKSTAPVKIGYKAPVAVAKLIFEEGCKAEGLVCAAAGTAQAGQIELINLQGGGKAVPSLESEAVDGVVINEPFGSLAVVKKLGRVVTLLSELPPKGKWKAHPCCCVCATKTVVKEHPAVMQAFVKLMHAATEEINADKHKAAELAHAWTKNDLEVEKLSVPNIVYTTDMDAAYREGLARWQELMNARDGFSGTLRGVSSEELFTRVHDLTMLPAGN